MMFNLKNKNHKMNLNFFIVGLQYAILLINLLLNKYEVTSFKGRAIGNAMANGVDISLKTRTYSIILIILIPILTFAIFKILSNLFKDESNRTIKFMGRVATLSIINEILYFYLKLQNKSIFDITLFMLVAINAIIILTVLVSKKVNKKFEFIHLKWAIFASILLTFAMELCFHKLGINLASKSIEYVMMYALGIILLYLLIICKYINKNVFKKAYTFFYVCTYFRKHIFGSI